MTAPFTMPRLTDPERYTGLYVVQFAHCAAVGYLAEEIAILLSIDAYRDVPVFRIHRVDDSGCVEMIGVTAADLMGQEVLLFGCRDSAEATRLFSKLRRLADDHPLPCPARVELVDLPDLPAPHAVCLLYSRYANTMVSDWLLQVSFDGADQVLCGQEAASARHHATAAPVATATLAARIEFEPRSREELLATVEDALQR